MGCASKRERYPAPIDYELLDRKMAVLREQGIIGPRPYDGAAWARMESRLREAEARREREKEIRRSHAVAVLERVERAEEQRRMAQERQNANMQAHLQRTYDLQLVQAGE